MFRNLLVNGGRFLGTNYPQLVTDEESAAGVGFEFSMIRDLGNVNDIVLKIVNAKETDNIDAEVKALSKKFGLGPWPSVAVGAPDTVAVVTAKSYFAGILDALKERFKNSAPRDPSIVLPPPPPPIVVPPPPIVVPAPGIPFREEEYDFNLLAEYDPFPDRVPEQIQIVPARGSLADRDLRPPQPEREEPEPPRVEPTPYAIQKAISDCWNISNIEKDFEPKFFTNYRSVISAKINFTVSNYEEILVFGFWTIEIKMDSSIENFAVAIRKVLKFGLEKMAAEFDKIETAEEKARVARKYAAFLKAVNESKEALTRL